MTITQNDVGKITHSDLFHQVVRKRRTVSISLTSIMLAVYFGFILLIAFNKPFLTIRVGEHITLGLILGIGVIVFAWILTGIYIRWANTSYDRSVKDLKDHLTQITGH